MTFPKPLFAVTAFVDAIATTMSFAQSEETVPSTEITQAEDVTASVSEQTSDRPILRHPVMAYDGYSEIKIGEISTNELEGAKVYGSDEKKMGDVEALLLSSDSSVVEHIVFDIGGFLGMGVHKIALTPDEVQIMRDDNGEKIRVYIDATKDQLKLQPEYES